MLVLALVLFVAVSVAEKLSPLLSMPFSCDRCTNADPGSTEWCLCCFYNCHASRRQCFQNAFCQHETRCDTLEVCSRYAGVPPAGAMPGKPATFFEADGVTLKRSPIGVLNGGGHNTDTDSPSLSGGYGGTPRECPDGYEPYVIDFRDSEVGGVAGRVKEVFGDAVDYVKVRAACFGSLGLLPLSLNRLQVFSSLGVDTDYTGWYSPNENCDPSGVGIGAAGHPDSDFANCDDLGNVLVLLGSDGAVCNKATTIEIGFEKPLFARYVKLLNATGHPEIAGYSGFFKKFDDDIDAPTTANGLIDSQIDSTDLIKTLKLSLDNAAALVELGFCAKEPEEQPKCSRNMICPLGGDCVRDRCTKLDWSQGGRGRGHCQNHGDYPCKSNHDSVCVCESDPSTRCQEEDTQTEPFSCETAFDCVDEFGGCEWKCHHNKCKPAEPNDELCVDSDADDCQGMQCIENQCVVNPLTSEEPCSTEACPDGTCGEQGTCVCATTTTTAPPTTTTTTTTAPPTTTTTTTPPTTTTTTTTTTTPPTTTTTTPSTTTTTTAETTTTAPTTTSTLSTTTPAPPTSTPTPTPVPCVEEKRCGERPGCYGGIHDGLQCRTINDCVGGYKCVPLEDSCSVDTPCQDCGDDDARAHQCAPCRFCTRAQRKHGGFNKHHDNDDDDDLALPCCPFGEETRLVARVANLTTNDVVGSVFFAIDGDEYCVTYDFGGAELLDRLQIYRKTPLTLLAELVPPTGGMDCAVDPVAVAALVEGNLATFFTSYDLFLTGPILSVTDVNYLQGGKDKCDGVISGGACRPRLDCACANCIDECDVDVKKDCETDTLLVPDRLAIPDCHLHQVESALGFDIAGLKCNDTELSIDPDFCRALVKRTCPLAPHEWRVATLEPHAIETFADLCDEARYGSLYYDVYRVYADERLVKVTIRRRNSLLNATEWLETDPVIPLVYLIDANDKCKSPEAYAPESVWSQYKDLPHDGGSVYTKTFTIRVPKRGSYLVIVTALERATLPNKEVVTDEQTRALRCLEYKIGYETKPVLCPKRDFCDKFPTCHGSRDCPGEPCDENACATDYGRCILAEPQEPRRGFCPGEKCEQKGRPLCKGKPKGTPCIYSQNDRNPINGVRELCFVGQCSKSGECEPKPKPPTTTTTTSTTTSTTTTPAPTTSSTLATTTTTTTTTTVPPTTTTTTTTTLAPTTTTLAPTTTSTTASTTTVTTTLASTTTAPPTTTTTTPSPTTTEPPGTLPQLLCCRSSNSSICQDSAPDDCAGGVLVTQFNCVQLQDPCSLVCCQNPSTDICFGPIARARCVDLGQTPLSGSSNCGQQPSCIFASSSHQPIPLEANLLELRKRGEDYDDVEEGFDCDCECPRLCESYLDCNDGNATTIDLCDEKTGVCVNRAHPAPAPPPPPALDVNSVCDIDLAVAVADQPVVSNCSSQPLVQGRCIAADENDNVTLSCLFIVLSTEPGASETLPNGFLCSTNASSCDGLNANDACFCGTDACVRNNTNTGVLFATKCRDFGCPQFTDRQLDEQPITGDCDIPQSFGICVLANTCSVVLAEAGEFETGEREPFVCVNSDCDGTNNGAACVCHPDNAPQCRRRVDDTNTTTLECLPVTESAEPSFVRVASSGKHERIVAAKENEPDVMAALDRAELAYTASVFDIYGGLVDGQWASPLCGVDVEQRDIEVSVQALPGECAGVNVMNECLDGVEVQKALGHHWFDRAWRLLDRASQSAQQNKRDALTHACCASFYYSALAGWCGRNQGDDYWQLNGAIVVRKNEQAGAECVAFDDGHRDRDLNDWVAEQRVVEVYGASGVLRSINVHVVPLARGGGYRSSYAVSARGVDVSSIISGPSAACSERARAVLASTFDKAEVARELSARTELVAGTRAAVFHHVLRASDVDKHSLPNGVVDSFCVSFDDAGTSYCARTESGDVALFDNTRDPLPPVPENSVGDYYDAFIESLPNIDTTVNTRTATRRYAPLFAASAVFVMPANVGTGTGAASLRFVLRNDDCGAAVVLPTLPLNAPPLAISVPAEACAAWRWAAEGVPLIQDARSDERVCRGGSAGGIAECSAGTSEQMAVCSSLGGECADSPRVAGVPYEFAARFYECRKCNTEVACGSKECAGNACCAERVLHWYRYVSNSALVYQPARI